MPLRYAAEGTSTLRRRLFNLAMAVSLVLGVATVFGTLLLWYRSYGTVDAIVLRQEAAFADGPGSEYVDRAWVSWRNGDLIFGSTMDQRPPVRAEWCILWKPDSGRRAWKSAPEDVATIRPMVDAQRRPIRSRVLLVAPAWTATLAAGIIVALGVLLFRLTRSIRSWGPRRALLDVCKALPALLLTIIVVSWVTSWVWQVVGTIDLRKTDSTWQRASPPKYTLTATQVCGTVRLFCNWGYPYYEHNETGLYVRSVQSVDEEAQRFEDWAAAKGRSVNLRPGSDPSFAFQRSGGQWPSVEVVFPHWLLAILCLSPYVPAVLGTFRRAARRRRNACLRCGYDLRATPGRCPECGAVADPAPRAAA